MAGQLQVHGASILLIAIPYTGCAYVLKGGTRAEEWLVARVSRSTRKSPGRQSVGRIGVRGLYARVRAGELDFRV